MHFFIKILLNYLFGETFFESDEINNEIENENHEKKINEKKIVIYITTALILIFILLVGYHLYFFVPLNIQELLQLLYELKEQIDNDIFEEITILIGKILHTPKYKRTELIFSLYQLISITKYSATDPEKVEELSEKILEILLFEIN